MNVHWFPGARRDSVRSGSTSGWANRRFSSDSRVAAGLVQERRATAMPFTDRHHTQLSTDQKPTRLEERGATAPRYDGGAPESKSPLAIVGVDSSIEMLGKAAEARNG